MPYKDPAKAKANSARRYQEQKRLWKNADGSWKQQDPKARAERRRSRYATDQEHRAKVLAYNKTKRRRAAVGQCPLCLKTQVPLYRDHCHKTERQRGLICSHCNLMLGHAFDNPATMRRAIAYLAT